MSENAPPEPFSCVTLFKYVMKLLIEKRNVLMQAFLSTFKIIFLRDT